MTLENDDSYNKLQARLIEINGKQWKTMENNYSYNVKGLKTCGNLTNGHLPPCQGIPLCATVSVAAALQCVLLSLIHI